MSFRLPFAALALAALGCGSVERDPDACESPHWQRVSVPSTSARSGHTAVWTGREVIVWGGRDDLTQDKYNYLASGFALDPERRSIRALSLAKAPVPRTQHLAGFVAGRMLIWGGCSVGGTGQTLVGGEYDPETDTWSALPPDFQPAFAECLYVYAARGPESVWLVWGTMDGNGTLQPGGRYDVAARAWTPMSTTGGPTGTISGAGSASVEGRLVLFGGVYDDPVGGGFIYGPVSDQWATLPTENAPAVRTAALAWVEPAGEIVVWGIPDTPGAPKARAGGRLDWETLEWKPMNLDGGPGLRIGATVVAIGRRVLVYGGHDGVGTLDTGAIYDLDTDSWQSLPTECAPGPQSFLTITPIDDRRAVVWTAGGLAFGARPDDEPEAAYILTLPD